MHMDIEKAKSEWKCLLEEYYSDKPRLKDLLDKAELLERDNGYEIRIPVNNTLQEDWLTQHFLAEAFVLIKEMPSKSLSNTRPSICYIREDGTIIQPKVGKPWIIREVVKGIFRKK